MRNTPRLFHAEQGASIDNSEDSAVPQRRIASAIADGFLLALVTASSWRVRPPAPRSGGRASVQTLCWWP